MNHEAVYRTAPATPGLLKTELRGSTNRRPHRDILSFHSFCGQYCSAVFGTSLTQEQTRKLTNIERTCLKVILQESYVSYEAALEMTGLSSLTDRRSRHILLFAKRAARHPVHGPRMFPLTPNIQELQNLREREKYQVNYSRGAAYYNSTIPTSQRLLNQAK